MRYKLFYAKLVYKDILLHEHYGILYILLYKLVVLILRKI